MAKRRSNQPPKESNSIMRIASGVSGLDTVLGGGLVENGLYLIEGMAGTGKTILSSQICFHQVREGKKVLFVTLIAESHAKLLQHLGSMAYFDPEAVSKSFILLSGYDALTAGGLQGFLEFIAGTVREHRPSFMVVDGFRTARQARETELGLSEFIHQLNAFITGSRCTTVLLAPFSGSEPHPEHTLVDGLIELNHYASGMRRTREIEVHKLRAANHLVGKHTFEITEQGVVIFPRLEALQADGPVSPLNTQTRLAFGVSSFDRIIDGGLVAGSVTTILGPPGAGKTLLGLKFLEDGLRNHERCLYLGFYEPPQRLVGKAKQLGIALGTALKSSELQVIWQPPVEQSLDELGHRLLETVRTSQIKRVFLDGIEGFCAAAVHLERVTFFMAALTNHLRKLGTTTLFSEETDLYGAEIRHTAFGVSAFIENVILLRYGELRSRLYRLISIIKLRESSYDSAVHEFSISSRGLDVTASSQSAEKLLADKPQILKARSRLSTGKGGRASTTKRARGSPK